MVAGSVFGNLFEKEMLLLHSVCPTDSSSHFCLENSVCPLQQVGLKPLAAVAGEGHSTNQATEESHIQTFIWFKIWLELMD